LGVGEVGVDSGDHHGPLADLRLRCPGTARNNAWLKNRTAALNLRNLLSRGLTRDNAAWVLG
jgi:hypothetical protein